MDFGLIFGICVVAAGIYVALKLVSINRGEEDWFLLLHRYL